MKPSYRRILATTLPLLSLLPVIPGCAGDPAPQLMVQSNRMHQTFSEPFAAAYASQAAGGDTTLVAVDRASQQTLEGNPGPAPVRQVLSVRVMWNPTRDSRWDHNSASNATVHWYVMGNTPATAAEVIEYSGTAVVMVDHDQDVTTLTIRSAYVKPVAWRGSLHNPIGASELHGTLRASDNAQRVRQILSDVRTVVAAANSLPNTQAKESKPEAPSTLAR